MYSSDSSRAGDLRSRFTDGSIETASSERVIVMCFDRLDRDLDNALTSIAAEDHDTTNSKLCHAQDLIAELVAMLDVDVWEHATALLSVYDYLLRRLAQANVLKDAAAVREARHLISEIGSAFRAAAETISATPATQVTPTEANLHTNPKPTPFGTSQGAERARISVQA